MEPIPIVLKVDGQRVPMNPFVQRIFIQTILGMVRSLDGVPEDLKEIRLVVKQSAAK